MNSNEVRSAYLKFFEEKGHTVIPSSSLVPKNDPTLLFTTAGMVQFKNYYLGIEVPPNKRLASCQKSFRTTDIESVGDTKHLTFFEMLGNFSIGDYFKNEAIGWAWEFVTERLKIPADKIWITVYTDDEEAFKIWNKTIGVPEDRIMRFGAKDNFWGPAGSSGPCGPCSELHFDFGDQCGCGSSGCNPGCGCGRFVEIWNLVFTQFNQDENKVRTPLPNPNIDTGMGLERISAVVQGKPTVYETDIFASSLQAIALTANKKYGDDGNDDNAMRVIAEHSRAISFLIADGVMPANEGRGYVLRRLLRRAALFGKRLGLEKLFLADICKVAIEHMKQIYPELEQRRELVIRVVELEESRFHETLNNGLALLDGLIEGAASQVRQEITGNEIFKLYDTYGFPVELTREIAARAGLTVDTDGFEKEMEKQKERARAAHKFDNVKNLSSLKIRDSLKPSESTGYQYFKLKTRISDILVDNTSCDLLIEGQEASLILEATPFYGEMGGQVGDTGVMSAGTNKFSVTNTIHFHEYILHQGKLESGSLRVGDEIMAEVDSQRRKSIAANHTTTHLLQFALRQVLGQHVQQRGSMVGPFEFRFDFSHLTAMTDEEILRVEHLVNEKIRENLIVNIEHMNYKKAVAEGAMALFDEKYGETVRVIKIGDPTVSAELCGGTHVSATGQIGFFKVTAESSIGAGLRRIEGVTGKGAETFIEHNYLILQKIAETLGTSPSSAHEKLALILKEMEIGKKIIADLEKEQNKKGAENLLNNVEIINGIKVLTGKIPDAKVESLRDVADSLKNKLVSAIIVLCSISDDRPLFIAMVTPDLIQKGYHAGEIVKQVAKVTGGGGGGKPGMAQAGGKDKSRIDEALSLVKTLIK